MSSNQRVLIVDNEAKWRNTIISLVELAGYPNDSCGSIPEAKELLDSHVYGLALIDLCMEGDQIKPDDREFWRFLRTNFRYLPTIAITGHYLDMKEVYNLGKEGGFSNFMNKNDLTIPQFRELVNTNIRFASNEDHNIISKFDKSNQQPKELKKELKSLIADGQTPTLITELLQLCKHDTELLNLVILQAAKWNDLERNSLVGARTEENMIVMRGLVNDNLLKIIDKLFGSID